MPSGASHGYGFIRWCVTLLTCVKFQKSPCSLFSLPCSLFPVPCSLKPRTLYLTKLKTTRHITPHELNQKNLQ
ncbi:MAG: hypothetical protein F6K55_34365 [Moorea sp. SIO4A3]|nr:hypothetical protein [Moorena sp. SIO4A3]